jgi:ribonucleoside-diphosphate reductase alpha chain
VASVESADQGMWERRFFGLLEGYRFLPGGRILAGAGVDLELTLFNCFVMGSVPDDMAGIFESLKEGALTMQRGGGVGYDFSALRPAGLRGRRVGGIASGPVSFMRIWDSMCATVLSARARRGAMMGTLRCDHPDIERFIDAKREPGELRNFNLSVLVTDAFMEAVMSDASWSLVFPVDRLGSADLDRFPARVERSWSDSDGPLSCAVIREVPARTLWSRLMRASYDTAEPGVLFIDRIQAEDNLGYRERIVATNPCGEIPLPPYGACDLGSLNLTAFVLDPFESSARFDLTALAAAAATAVRLLDDVIDLSRFPLPAQARQARGSRRIGLGITGLADALILLGQRYDGDAGREQAAEAMRTVCHAAYRTSVALAEEKGAFPFFDQAAYLDARFVRRLPASIGDGIRRHGIRNSHLIAVAPAGSISLLAGNVSSGIEPVFSSTQKRRVRLPGGGEEVFETPDPALSLWRTAFGIEYPPPAFVDAYGVAPEDHLAMQAAVQPYVDNAVSKTVNVPESLAFSDFERLYRRAFELGLKGCTVFRPNTATGAVLCRGDADAELGSLLRCCGLD